MPQATERVGPVYVRDSSRIYIPYPVLQVLRETVEAGVDARVEDAVHIRVGVFVHDPAYGEDHEVGNDAVDVAIEHGDDDATLAVNTAAGDDKMETLVVCPAACRDVSQIQLDVTLLKDLSGRHAGALLVQRVEERLVLELLLLEQTD